MKFLSVKRKIKKLLVTFKEEGLREVIYLFYNKYFENRKIYQRWIEENKLSEETIISQKKHKFKYSPKISIVVPLYKTPNKLFIQMVNSVIDQTYDNWELCIADGSGRDFTKLDADVESFLEKTKKIKYKKLLKNLGISENSNHALKMATGDYVALLDHDDVLSPDALYEVVKSLQKHKYDILYSDEDFISANSRKYMKPIFKPDWSPDLLHSHNYITHFLVVKMSLIKSINGFNKKYDGAQDYDLILRCTEKSDDIYHIPKILYHWRIAKTSVASNSKNKLYAYDAGKKALEDHFSRLNIDVEVDHLDKLGYYHVKYKVLDNPKVSIVIPNKDQVEYLNKCIISLYNVNEYHNFEVLIVDNNSVLDETYDFYSYLTKKYRNLRIINYEGKFNYSKINNFAAGFVDSEYILFLNNDTEMINSLSIYEMLGLCMQKHVGVVGSKLLYHDNTIQHAGVVLGFGGSAGHVFSGLEENTLGYALRPQLICNYSAVTAACFMTKTSLFKKVEGFDEKFTIALNDIDYCLKIRELNYFVAYTPFSLWYHYESKTRGYEDTAIKKQRFESETSLLQFKWPKYFNSGDPFYNINFAIDDYPYHLRLNKFKLKYYIENIRILSKNGQFEVNGWAVTERNSKIDIKVYKVNKFREKQISETSVEFYSRPDLKRQNFSHDVIKNAGFTFCWNSDFNQNFRLSISDGVDEISYEISVNDLIDSNKCVINERTYNKWLIKHTDEINSFNILNEASLSYTVIVPCSPKESFQDNVLKIKSTLDIKYSNFNIVFLYGNNDEKLLSYLNKICKTSSNVTIRNFEDNNIAKGINLIANDISSDYILLLNDRLVVESNILNLISHHISSSEDVDLIYWDDDCQLPKKKWNYNPHFKPDINIDMLCSWNYISSNFIVRTKLVKELEGFNESLKIASMYDFLFKCYDKHCNIVHVPFVLTHYLYDKYIHIINGKNLDEKPDLYIKSLENHFSRNKLRASITTEEGFYKSNYSIKSKPLVSVIILNRDHVEDLEKCLNSLLSIDSYDNLEIIIVENNSSNPTTLKYYKKLKNNRNIKILTCNLETFNYSKLNNYGVLHSSGEYLLFLNNDVEFKNKNSINSMLNYCSRKDVGAVGCKLLYPNGAVQHAGVTIGFGGGAGHNFLGITSDSPGYFSRAIIAQDVSAVTAACMMVKRDVFDLVNGFDENYAVAFNDVDFCLKIREEGYLIVYNPYVELIHDESKTRGSENTHEKEIRFQSELALLRKRWMNILANGDPFYNKNLSLSVNNFNLYV